MLRRAQADDQPYGIFCGMNMYVPSFAATQNGGRRAVAAGTWIVVHAARIYLRAAADLSARPALRPRISGSQSSR
jgi:hypothetical protein